MVGGWAAWFLARRPRLDEVLEDRTNNFDMIRLVAASLVIYGHSYFEVPDGSGMDLVQRALGEAEYAGSVAVYVFFLISGMLITASMEKQRSILSFVVLRFARIWPGFAACTAALVFLAVPVASGVSLKDPLWLRAASSCWRQNALFFIHGYCGSLPRAFLQTLMPDLFGFSWWTLPAEVHCYAMVLVLGIALQSRFSNTAAERWRFAALTSALLAGFLVWTCHPPGENVPFHAEFVIMGGYSSYPVLFFFAGMMLYNVRRSVPIDGIVAAVLAVLALMLPQPNPLVYVALTYGVLALAEAKPLRHLKPRHDLSYGIYIYGAAVQQIVGTLLPGRSALVNFAVSLSLALCVAATSWHLVEAPALQVGRFVVKWWKDREFLNNDLNRGNIF